jgi:hypothetical protein
LSAAYIGVKARILVNLNDMILYLGVLLLLNVYIKVPRDGRNVDAILSGKVTGKIVEYSGRNESVCFA